MTVLQFIWGCIDLILRPAKDQIIIFYLKEHWNFKSMCFLFAKTVTMEMTKWHDIGIRCEPTIIS